MNEEKTKIWAWLVASGRLYRVVSNPADGAISVYNPEGTLVKRYENLSKAEVCLIEKTFLETVATLLNGNETETEQRSTQGNEMADEIAMYIR